MGFLTQNIRFFRNELLILTGKFLYSGFPVSIVESEKVGLKLNIQKTKIMASDPITSWEIDGETVSDFNLGGSKITADGDCSHEIKRRLLLGRKVMTNLDSIFKSRDITLPTKVRLLNFTNECDAHPSMGIAKKKGHGPLVAFFI